MTEKSQNFTCTECGSMNCYRRDKDYPGFCLTSRLRDEELDEVKRLYNDEENLKIMQAAAELEGKYYGSLTRVEETIKFAKMTGAKKIGIASCLGLIEEARIFSRILKINGLESYCVVCKVGSIDKTEFDLPDDLKLKPGGHESMCNPILQAKILNEQETDINVLIGLCVGHDMLFNKYSEAPVTTLIAKDRVLAHNPAAALYTSKSYYKRLLQDKKE